MNRKQLLKLYKANGGKTVIEVKVSEPAQPYQLSRVEKYQMVGGGK
jgi:hypothetical protein